MMATLLDETRSALVREELLAVLRAASKPMRSNEVLERTRQIGGITRPTDLVYGLNVLARSMQIRLVGRVPGAVNAERIWQYRVPDDQCVMIDQA